MGGMVESAFNLGLSPYETFMDSVGITRHGRDMAHQEAMAREQMKWQSGENQLNRDFSQQMYEQQRDDYLKNYPELMKMQTDAQFNLWKNQFAQQNAYNSPQESVARNMVAGISPIQQGALATGANSMGASSVSPPPIIQGSPLGGTASPVGLPQGMSEGLMRDLGGFIKDMSQADVNRETIEKLASEVDKFLAEKDLIDSQRSFQEMKNGVYQVLGYTKETKEIIKLVKEAYEAEATGDNMLAAKKFNDANKELADSERKINEEKLPWVSKIMKSEYNRNMSEVRRNNAQADEAIAVKELKESQKKWQDFENTLKEQEVDPDVLKSRLQALIMESEAKGQISRSAAQHARLEADRVGSILERRGKSAAFEFIDDVFEWVKGKLPFSGSINIGASSSTSTSHSDVNVHKE